jgi:hypothetical protein
MRLCKTCNKEKEDREFHSGKRDQYSCKECNSEYKKQHYKKNKEKYIKKAKLKRQEYRKEYYDWLSTQKCKDCGISDHRVLEQDHIDNKSFNISKKVGSMRLESLMKELNKCEVVCANCHRIRTASRGDWERSKL